MSKILSRLWLCLALLGFPGCGERTGDAADPTLPTQVERINAADVRALLEQESKVAVLDVRTPHEFAAGHIPGATNLSIQSASFSQLASKLDREKAYLVHCAAGSPNGRSTKAAQKLVSLGFSKVYHLDGGYLAWEGQAKEN